MRPRMATMIAAIYQITIVDMRVGGSDFGGGRSVCRKGYMRGPRDCAYGQNHDHKYVRSTSGQFAAQNVRA